MDRSLIGGPGERRAHDDLPPHGAGGGVRLAAAPRGYGHGGHRAARGARYSAERAAQPDAFERALPARQLRAAFQAAERSPSARVRQAPGARYLPAEPRLEADPTFTRRSAFDRGAAGSGHDGASARRLSDGRF